MKPWIDAEKQQPEPWVEVLCWHEYFSYKRNRMRQAYGIGLWTGERWTGEVAQGHRTKVLFWTPLPARPRKKYRREKSNGTEKNNSRSCD